jgi:hypothetical protein
MALAIMSSARFVVAQRQSAISSGSLKVVLRPARACEKVYFISLLE